jgi:hypothetical protein
MHGDKHFKIVDFIIVDSTENDLLSAVNDYKTSLYVVCGQARKRVQFYVRTFMKCLDVLGRHVLI